MADAASGRPAAPGLPRAPVDGPPDPERATAELANRLLRAWRRTPIVGIGDAAGLLEISTELAREAAAAAAASFAYLDPGKPRDWLTLPGDLALASASLAVQEALRGLASARAVPPERLGDFLAFTVETFTDLPVYFSLQYREELERLRARVGRRPGDARTRLALGRTLMKCGLFREAAAELDEAARAAAEPGRIGEPAAGRAGAGSAAVRRRARYESAVACYRRGAFAEAVERAAEALALDPADEKARFWLWLAAGKTGGYPESVPAEHRMAAVDGHAPCPVELEEVSGRLGLDKVCGGRGTAVADFLGNGRLDLVVAGAHAGCSLYRNEGPGPDGVIFTDVSTGSGLDRCVYAFTAAAGDFDNDGRPDLYLSSLGFFDGCGRLMRNRGDGTFTDVTREAGLEAWGPGFTATWVDYDRDGWLDLFVAYNLGGLFDRKTPNRLFRNNRDGTFTDVTREAGLETPWPTIGAAWGDVDNDGWPDLFLSNLGRAQLFRNNGDGTFTDASREAGIDRPAIGSVAFWCDLDDDGWLDLVQMTYSRPADAIYTLRHGQGPPGGSPMRLFRNRRDGTFADVARELGVTGCWGTMSANAGDFDNDGRLDLFLGNGDPGMDRTEASVLLRNTGGRFENVTFTAGLPPTGKGHGVNLAALAGDGRLHLIVASGGLYPGDLQPTEVYRPKTRPGNYLAVRLAGTASNRDAIGARLALTAGGRTQHRLASGGSNFGCLPLEQHFGLGELTEADELRIRWPSGLEQTIESPPVNATVRVVEGKEGWEPV
jgi:tetratricopeptide (TPR) repeat protein